MKNNQQKLTARQIFQKNYGTKLLTKTQCKVQKVQEKKNAKSYQIKQGYNNQILQILAESINMIESKTKIPINEPTKETQIHESQSISIQSGIKKTESSSFTMQKLTQKQSSAPKGKSRAKIFKEELIDSISSQIKTSIHRWQFGTGQTASKLVIGNWNVNGMRSVYSKKHLLTYINTRKPDILCITQTKMDQKNFDQSPIQLNGYNSYWNFSKCSSGYSGVVVFTKYLPKKGVEDMIEREHSQQGRMLTLWFQKFILINIYCPTSGKDLERLTYRQKYDNALRNHIKNLKEQYPNKPIMIVGDLNVAHTELDTHPGKNITSSPGFTFQQRKAMTDLFNMGFTDVWRALNPETRAYTWWYVNIGGRDKLQTTGLGRRIDYFILHTQCMRWVKRCEILRQIMGADHCPLQMQIDLDL